MVNSTHWEQKLKHFTANMVEARRLRGWTQEDLADCLRDAGMKFYAQTVQKIETGERRIQLAEAIEIAKVLDQGLEIMLEPPQNNLIGRYHSEADDAAMDVTFNANNFIGKQLNLAKILDELEGAGDPVPGWAVETLDISLESRIELARSLYVGEAGGDADDAATRVRDFAVNAGKAGPHVQQAVQALGLPFRENDDE